MLGLTAFSYDLIDKCDDCLVHIVSLINSLDHLCFRDLVGTGLDHDHSLGSRCHGQLQIAFDPLLLGRIDDEFAIDHAHLSHGTGSIEGDIRNTGCNGSAQHANQFRTALRIYCHYHTIQGYIITVILGE